MTTLRSSRPHILRNTYEGWTSCASLKLCCLSFGRLQVTPKNLKWFEADETWRVVQRRATGNKGRHYRYNSRIQQGVECAHRSASNRFLCRRGVPTRYCPPRLPSTDPPCRKAWQPGGRPGLLLIC